MWKHLEALLGTRRVMRNKRFSLDNGPSDTNDQCGEAIQQFLGIGTHLGQEKGSEEGTINPASSAS
jgi:hypothetical protein